MHRQRCIVRGTILVLALLLAACGGSGSRDSNGRDSRVAVPAAKWRKTVCGPYNDYATNVRKAITDGPSLGENPSPADFQASVAIWLDGLVQNSEPFSAALSKAGYPDVRDGAKYVALLRRFVRTSIRVSADARDRLSKVDITTPTGMTGIFERVSRGFSSASQRFAKDLAALQVPAAITDCSR